MFSKIRVLIKTRPIFVTGLLLVFSCCLVYLLNGRTISSNDNIPHTLLGFNWLINHTLNLDSFRDSYFYGAEGQCLRCERAAPYFFLEAPNGHLTSTYPVGTALVSFPLYACFYVYLKLASLIQLITTGTNDALLDITSRNFDDYRRLFEKLAGTLTTALSVLIFYLITRLKFSPFVALFSTFIFAFCTSTWSLISQGLRQHTIANLVTLALLLCVLKINRLDGHQRRVLILVAGFFCGLLPGIRITSVFYAAAAVLYLLYYYRRDALFLLLGLTSSLFNAFWNFYYFGFSAQNFLVGGYTNQFESGASSYDISWSYFREAFLGLLFSTSDGFFVYSPILLLALLGVVQVIKLRSQPDEQAIAAFTLAAGVIFVHYCVYKPWNGGAGSFGSRFMTDVLPITCVLIPYGLMLLAVLWQRRQWLKPVAVVLIGLAVSFSVYVQAVGAFTDTDWGTVPLPLSISKERLWTLNDSQIERHTRNLFAQIANPISDNQDYLQQTDGVIERLTTPDGQSLPSPWVIQGGKRLVLQATVRNTGQVPWYGYQTGLVKGETRIQCVYLNDADRQVRTGYPDRLYVSGTPKPGETAIAIGQLRFPPKAGRYRLRCNFTVHRVGDFPSDGGQPAYETEVVLKRGRQPSINTVEEP